MMSKQATENMLLVVEANSENESGVSFFLANTRHEWWLDDEAVKVSTVKITYEYPDSLSEDEFRVMAIKTLRDKQDRVIAEAQLTKVDLQNKIDKLLMLTHQPAASELEPAPDVITDETRDIPF